MDESDSGWGQMEDSCDPLMELRVTQNAGNSLNGSGNTTFSNWTLVYGEIRI